jgi:hypothetical protein
VVEYNKGNKPQYDLILGTETMEEFGIMLDFKAKTITIDWIILPMRNINHLQGASTLRASKLNNICVCVSGLWLRMGYLAMELKSTQDTTKHAT